MPRLAPSVLTCDFTDLKSALARIDACGCDYVHCDVMDGCFVPPITFGAKMVEDFAKTAQTPLDVHCMTHFTNRQAADFAAAGAQSITFHIEAPCNTEETLRHIRMLGVQAGLALNPQTPQEALLPYLPLVDLVLVMSVRPGYGGQAFLPASLDKIRFFAQHRAQAGLAYAIEVDGGVNLETAPLCTAAGADILVCGNAFFGAKDAKAFAEKVTGRG